MKRKILAWDSYVPYRNLQKQCISPLIGAIILISCVQAVRAQVSAKAEPAATAIGEIQPLNIGDPIPDEVRDMPLQVVNHPAGKEIITLADYKDKLIIIDFWATWCKPCISSLYKLDTLQREFSDGLAVIPTTYEDAAKAELFFVARGWHLPTVVSETKLKIYFPYLSIPHQVWIKDGKVLTITGPEYSTSDYIGKVLEGEYVDFDHKSEVAFDKSKPLFLNGNGGDGSNMLYQSIISGRLQARIAGVNQPSSNQVIIYNCSIETLYKTALQNSPLIPFTYERYITYEVHDTIKYRLNTRMVRSIGDKSLISPWAEENTYCYNLVLPPRFSSEEVSARMLRDLNDFFGNHLNVNVNIEKRQVPALAIVKTKNYQDIATQGDVSYRNWDSDRKALVLINEPLNSLIEFMNSMLDNRPKLNLDPYPYPIVDETGIGANVDLTIKADFLDIRSLRQALNEYGLDLVEKVSPVTIIVFSYSQNPNNK